MGLLRPSWELPNGVDGGGPAGVKEPNGLPGSPAGVVEGFEPGLPVKPLPCRLESGVDGRLEEKGTWKVDMAMCVEVQALLMQQST